MVDLDSIMDLESNQVKLVFKNTVTFYSAWGILRKAKTERERVPGDFLHRDWEILSQ